MSEGQPTDKPETADKPETPAAALAAEVGGSVGAAGAEASASAMSGIVVREGWLTKEGAKWKTWKRRWFMLNESNTRLFYYPSKRETPDDKYLGFVNLDDATCAIALEPEAKGGKRHLFQIVTPSRTWYLQAESEEIKNMWLSTMHAILDRAAPPKQTPRTVGVEDFQLLKLIGKGNFGKVMLVRMKDTDDVFAMKVLSKKQIIENNEIEHTMAECNILQRLRHPFLINMHYAFQTKENLYLILDFVNGGELFHHLQTDKRFTENRVRFYAAEILLGLEYLHNSGVLYRDLKLENLLLTAEGHIVLTDFGLSKEGLVGSDAITGTFCGTPEYMAPEMISGNGYGKAVDWWSFGSLIYEMLTGLPPFYNQDVQQMYRLILTARLTFPPYMSDTARSLVHLLLEKDPSKRFTNPEFIKRHSFFEGIDWDALYRKKITPPFIPPVKSAVDISQIDPMFTEENPTLDMSSMGEGGSPDPNAPVSTEAAMQTAFVHFSYVSPEHSGTTTAPK